MSERDETPMDLTPDERARVTARHDRVEALAKEFARIDATLLDEGAPTVYHAMAKRALAHARGLVPGDIPEGGQQTRPRTFREGWNAAIAETLRRLGKTT